MVAVVVFMCHVLLFCAEGRRCQNIVVTKQSRSRISGRWCREWEWRSVRRL